VRRERGSYSRELASCQDGSMTLMAHCSMNAQRNRTRNVAAVFHCPYGV
jgi:hypothetical protein